MFCGRRFRFVISQDQIDSRRDDAGGIGISPIRLQFQKIFVVVDVNIHLGLAHIDGLTYLIQSAVLAIQIYLRKAGIGGVVYPNRLRKGIGYRIAQLGFVVQIGQQTPLFPFAQPKQFHLVGELDVIRCFFAYRCGVPADFHSGFRVVHIAVHTGGIMYSDGAGNIFLTADGVVGGKVHLRQKSRSVGKLHLPQRDHADALISERIFVFLPHHSR